MVRINLTLGTLDETSDQFRQFKILKEPTLKDGYLPSKDTNFFFLVQVFGNVSLDKSKRSEREGWFSNLYTVYYTKRTGLSLMKHYYMSKPKT